jgi:hypothetical protein
VGLLLEGLLGILLGRRLLLLGVRLGLRGLLL